MRISEKDIVYAIETAADILSRGGVIAFPTETFYGLGVKYNNTAALRRLYEIKQRPHERALPLIIGDRKMLSLIAETITDTEEKLMNKFWPGPLTILFDAKDNLPELVTAGTGKVAVRIPGKSFALELARKVQFPITATSANISGMLPADSPDNIVKYFGNELDLLIDGGKTGGGKPSTIVDVRGGEIIILRAGVVPPEEFQNL
jgi:L-threonylcarbamoyladenylate synthase